MEIFAGLVRFVVFNTDSRERKEKESGRRGAGVRDGAGLVSGRQWASWPVSFFFNKAFFSFFFLWF